jgi:RNA polymerase sigma factor (sigma-70 family)
MTVTLLSHAARTDPRADAELVSRFVSAHDSQAFAAVVHRHGPLVFGVCRRALGDTADADDAFQATFLVLVTKAGTLKKADALGPWLFGVAHRIARKARWKRGRRQSTEQQVDPMPHRELMTPDRLESDELSRAFDEELARLPDDMRQAVVLCELQGVSRADAARQLRISEGTLSSRLARARKKLAEALTRRGLGLAVPAAVAVSAKLSATTVELANGPAAVPAGVTYLVQEALKTMAISKLKLGAVVLAAAACCTLLAFAADKPTVKAEPTKAEAKPDPAKVVATVGGQEVTHDEFREFVFRRNLWSDVDTLLVLKVVKAEAAKRKVSVTTEEVTAAVAEYEKADEGKDVNYQVVPTTENGRQVWIEHQVIPDLLLAKLIGREAEPTEQELKTRFENMYGERRSYTLAQVFDLPGGERVANRPSKDKIDEPIRFLPVDDTTDKPGTHRDIKGELIEGTCGRQVEASDPLDQPAFLHTLFSIEKVGDSVRYSRPFGMAYRLTLTAVRPAVPGHSFESEKELIAKELRTQKLGPLKDAWLQEHVGPVRNQFLLDIAKEYDPKLNDEWKREGDTKAK